MVPVEEDPPVTPLTCHVTALLEALVTVAVNCVVLPRRVCSAPATLTVTEALAPEVGFEVTVLVLLMTPTEPWLRRCSIPFPR